MKFYLTIFLLCVSLRNIQAEEFSKEKLIAMANECKDETGATDEDMATMLKHEALTTTEAKCMRACLMKKGELMNAEGHLNKETFMKITEVLSKGDEAKEKAAEEVIDLCLEYEVPEDHCEAAEAYATCMRTYAEEKGLNSMELD